MQNKIRIGTRKSMLALVQTEIVRNKILEEFPDLEVEIVKMSTQGDEQLDRSLTSFGGKGVFTQELEAALQKGEIDLAVHSAKDMPMEFADGLGIGAALKRGPVEDMVVTLDGTPLAEMAPGSVVGTGSLRRELQIRKINPLIQVKLIRGNVQTRLRKLSEGQYDAIMLAAAGISRLEMDAAEEYYFEHLDPSVCLPAAGQAILAVECRDGDLKEILDRISDPEAMVCLSAERAYLRAIGGSCNAPAAALAHMDGEELQMEVMYAPDSVHFKKISGKRSAGLDPKEGALLGEELADRIRRGKVWLVGAGPGDLNLVTLRCRSCIRQADVIVYDSLATDSLLNEARPDAELIYAGKRSSHHHLKQEETNRLLIRLAMEGKQVVRLKGGDPFIFGRGGEEAQELREAGIEYEIVPGVSSCYGAPAYAGIPVTHRDFASSFHVITGHEGQHKTNLVLDYQTLAKEEGTLVFLMGLKNLPNIAAQLMQYGKNPETPAAVVQAGTTARQKVAVGPLKEIAEIAVREGIESPAVTVVGDVVSIREETDWFGKKPLSGAQVLVTATEKMAENLCRVLEEEGAEAVRFSLIRTEPEEGEALARAMDKLEDCTWIVFTSSNGVDLFFRHLQERGRDIRSLASVKFAVIGDGTRKELEKHNIVADFVPSAYSSRDLSKEWIPLLAKDDHVMLMRAREASRELPDALENAGIPYTDASLYHTAVDMRKAEELKRILPETDYVTLCSASAVRAFASMTKGMDIRAKIVCIGPVTERAARKEGLSVFQSAVVYTAEGIRDVLLYDRRNG